jgi:hypothetical protein
MFFGIARLLSVAGTGKDTTFAGTREEIHQKIYKLSAES